MGKLKMAANSLNPSKISFLTSSTYKFVTR